MRKSWNIFFKCYTFFINLIINYKIMNLDKKYQIITSSFEEKEITLRDLFDGKNKVLLYFYPKDNTPGCTLENKDFSCLKDEFLNIWIKVLWVSKDAILMHKNFIEKHSLQNDLISDLSLDLHKELWAYWEKNNYWKTVLWVIRSTFLFDENGELIKEWKNIKATWHAQRILKELQS